MKHREKRAAIRNFQKDVLLKRVCFENKTILLKIADVEQKHGFGKYADRLLENRNISIVDKATGTPSLASAQAVHLSDLKLPKETLAAICNGGSFQGKAWADQKISGGEWVFPNRVSDFYDKRFLYSFSAHFDHLSNFDALVKNSPGSWQPILDNARSVMRTTIKQESNFKNQSLRTKVPQIAENLYWEYVEGNKNCIFRLAVANAFTDLFKTTKFEIEIANKLVQSNNTVQASSSGRSSSPMLDNYIAAFSSFSNSNAFSGRRRGFFGAIGRFMTGLP